MLDRAPGVSIGPAEPQVRPIAPARSDVAAFVGIAERGPISEPTRVTSFKEFEQRFGTFFAPGFLAYSVKAFFENGGRAAWVVRTAASELGTVATSAAGVRLSLAPPLELRTGTVIALGQATGPGAQSATVLRRVRDADAAGAWIDLEAPVSGVDARERPPIDPTQPMQLTTGATLARVTVANAKGTVGALFTASSPGSWGNRVSLRVRTEVAAQTRATAVLDMGRQVQVESVAHFSLGTLVRVRQGALPPVHRVVCDVDAATRTLVLASADPSVVVQPATLAKALPSAFVVGPGTAPLTLEAVALHLLVLEDGAVVEDHLDWSPVFPARLGARLAAAFSRVSIVVNDPALPAVSLDPDDWPAPVDGLTLRGATDGVRMLSPADVLRELATLGPVAEPMLVAVPDSCAGEAPEVLTVNPIPPVDVTCTDPVWFTDPTGASSSTNEVVSPPPPAAPSEAGPDFSPDATALIAMGLVDFCERGVVDADAPPHPSFRFALVDVPASTDPIGFRRRFDASRAAIHWPWTGVHDPIGAAGAIRFVPASGHVAGSFAAMDLAIGPHHTAANTELRWVVALARDVGEADQAVYNDERVNCLRVLPNRGIRIYGARTLSSDSAWLYVPVRRLVSMVESSILTSMQWAVFEPASPTLRQLVRRSCLSLLDLLWERGAFAGTSRAEAFYVACDGSNNPPSAQQLGQLRVDIGIAPVRPAEFIVFRVGHQHEVLEVFEGIAA